MSTIDNIIAARMYRKQQLDSLKQKSKNPLDKLIGGVAAAGLTAVGMPWLTSALPAVGSIGAGLSEALAASGATSGAGLGLASLRAGIGAANSGSIGDALLNELTGGVQTGATAIAGAELSRKLGEMFPKRLTENDMTEMKQSGVSFRTSPAEGYDKVDTVLGDRYIKQGTRPDISQAFSNKKISMEELDKYSAERFSFDSQEDWENHVNDLKISPEARLELKQLWKAPTDDYGFTSAQRNTLRRQVVNVARTAVLKDTSIPKDKQASAIDALANWNLDLNLGLATAGVTDEKQFFEFWKKNGYKYTPVAYDGKGYSALVGKPTSSKGVPEATTTPGQDLGPKLGFMEEESMHRKGAIKVIIKNGRMISL